MRPNLPLKNAAVICSVVLASMLLGCGDESGDSPQRNKLRPEVESLRFGSDHQVKGGHRINSVVSNDVVAVIPIASKLKDCSSLNEALEVLNDECVARELPSETAKQFIRFYEIDEFATLSQVEILAPGAVKTAVIASVASAIHVSHGIDASTTWLEKRDFEIEKETAVFRLIYTFYPPGKATSSELRKAFSNFQSERLESEIQFRLIQETKAKLNR